MRSRCRNPLSSSLLATGETLRSFAHLFSFFCYNTFFVHVSPTVSGKTEFQRGDTILIRRSVTRSSSRYKISQFRERRTFFADGRNTRVANQLQQLSIFSACFTLVNVTKFETKEIEGLVAETSVNWVLCFVAREHIGNTIGWNCQFSFGNKLSVKISDFSFFQLLEWYESSL